MPQEVSAELRRVTERWRGLTPPRAEVGARLVREVVADLARETGRDVPVPDLGHEVLPDQLVVLVHDACEAVVPGVLQRLTRLRRAL